MKPATLKEIVLRHTVVGGYPDTMAIARDAYALAAAASGGDVKQAPGEAPQSGPKGNAHEQ